MKFKPNFEQYKKDQSAIDASPKIKADFHFVLNDISQKILAGVVLGQKDIADLEVVYDMTQDTEKEIILCMDNYRSSGVITKFESLIVCNHFLTSHHNGPNSEEIKFYLLERHVVSEDFLTAIQNTSIPEHTKNIIIQVYKKIQEHKE